MVVFDSVKTVENGWIFQLKTIKKHFHLQLENF